MREAQVKALKVLVEVQGGCGGEGWPQVIAFRSDNESQ